jgi:PIN domain nuclease of toxin-antitoxin system
MRVLVDSHAALWWVADDERLSETARQTIASASEPLLSAVSLFEVAIKASLRKLPVPARWADELLGKGFLLLPIGTAHGKELHRLPFVEVNGSTIRDPFDRMLVAQAQAEGVPVVTRDPAIAAHGVPTIW